jgi:flagellum-specific ATP synthase
MINIGAYAQGSNPEIDKAIATRLPANAFLQQNVAQPASLEESMKQLSALAAL